MFAGPNGSGKTTLYRALVRAEQFHELPFVNADELQAELLAGRVVPFDAAGGFAEAVAQTGYPGVERSVAGIVPRGAGIALAAGADCDAYLAAAIATVLRERMLSTSRSFAFESVFSDARKLELLRHARERGYQTYLYFVSTGDPALNVERVRQRVAEGGHDVPEDKVRERFARTHALLPRALRLCDRGFVFDSAGQATVHVATYDGRDGALVAEQDEVPEWVAGLFG